MKALASLTSGGPDSLQLTDLPAPVAGKGEVLVKIETCAINYPDALIIEDRYQVRPERPFAPGGEVAGTIAAVGEGVEGWAVGDRVIAVTLFGGLAEYAAVPVEKLFRLPDGIDFAEGSTFLITYATVLHALADRGALSAGDSLLVLGAAGGIGVATIEIGKALGARVVAAVSSEEKAEFARFVGADETVIYPRAPLDRDGAKSLSDAFKRAVGGEGAHVVLDPVGGDYCEPALRSMAWEGRYLVIGFTAGIPRPPLNLVLLKGCDIRGVFWGDFMRRAPERNRANVDQLFRWRLEGKLQPRIGDILPLERAHEAIARIGAGQVIGKIIVDVSGGNHSSTSAHLR